MSKGNRRVWSRVGSRPSASTILFLFPSSRSLFHSCFPYPSIVCATFALSLSLHRMKRAESSASNSRTSRSLCEYYSALHSRFFYRVMLYRDVPLHLRVKTSIRSCFSTGSFLHKFSASLRLDLLSSFVPIVLCRLQGSQEETYAGIHVH